MVLALENVIGFNLIKFAMSADEGPVTITATSSRIVSALEDAERETATLTQDVRTSATRRSGALSDEVLNAENALTDVKAQHDKAMDELALLKTRAKDLQIHCEQFTKANEGVSSRIMDLKARLVQEKSAKLDLMNNQYQDICNLHDLVTTAWTPETVKRLAAALKMRQPELQEHSRFLDAVLEGKRAELLQAQREGVAPPEGIDLEPEEKQASWQAFQDEAEALRRVLSLLVLKQQRLKDQIERLLNQN